MENTLRAVFGQIDTVVGLFCFKSRRDLKIDRLKHYVGVMKIYQNYILYICLRNLLMGYSSQIDMVE